jgi:hypothetical protein
MEAAPLDTAEAQETTAQAMKQPASRRKTTASLSRFQPQEQELNSVPGPDRMAWKPS